MWYRGLYFLDGVIKKKLIIYLNYNYIFLYKMDNLFNDMYLALVIILDLGQYDNVIVAITIVCL